MASTLTPDLSPAPASGTPGTDAARPACGSGMQSARPIDAQPSRLPAGWWIVSAVVAGTAGWVMLLGKLIA